MAYNNSSKLEAIQIIESVEEEDVGSGEKRQVIHVIEKYQNGPCLKDVLLKNQDLPICVISICGKTRTGKSFLLNLMIKYLESKGSNDWKVGSLPSVFEWRGGNDSVTKGLWICPKVFKLRNRSRKEVGILLLDNQGLFDGEQTGGVSMAISGISTTLSCYQIFNLKDKICENDLESIWRHLISDRNNLAGESATDLVFTVRDYIGEEEGCGLGHGRAYMEADKIRETQAHRDMWEGLSETFPEMLCLLLPHPGELVRKGKAEHMRDIEPVFLQEVELFFHQIFNPNSLTNARNISNSEQIYETIKKFDQKVADESLSFINVFTEQGNQSKLDLQMRNFESRIRSFQFNQTNGQALIEEFLHNARNMFRGSSAGDCVINLKKYMIQEINTAVEKMILERYENALRKSSDAVYTHSLEWGPVKARLNFFVGSDIEKEEQKEKVILSCAKLYYNILQNKLALRFESYAANKTLEGLQGYDEIFVSEEFKENCDFKVENPPHACNAVWLKEREDLRLFVENEILMYVAAFTNSKVDIDWLKSATKIQFKFYEMFTWNETHHIKIQKNDDSLLELIGYAMYRKAQKFGEYSKDEKEAIKLISKQVKTHSPWDPITLTCVFILYVHEKNESCEPIFKVKHWSGYIFIDIKGRTYQNWNGFQKENKLPDCLYCFPSGGEYNKRQGFRVGFTWSPASTFENKFWRVIDIAAKVAAVGATGALGAGVAFPAATAAAVSGAVAAATSGVYGLVRGMFKIKDKVTHDEPVKGVDVAEMIGSGLSVATAGVTAGAVLLTTIGKELSCAPAIVQGITSLTRLALELDGENINYLALANEISMLLLFNSKSVQGALDNIRTSYNLPVATSNLQILQEFISKNGIPFPQSDGEMLTTGQFFSENMKSFLLTAIANRPEQRPLEFLKEIVSALDDLRPLQRFLGEASSMEEQTRFFEELIKSIGTVIQNIRSRPSQGVVYHGTGYLPSPEVRDAVAMTGVCMGLSSVQECSNEECIQQVCYIAAEILKVVCEKARPTNIQDMTAYLERNMEDVVRKVQNMISCVL